jgi:hypothetical protein
VSVLGPIIRLLVEESFVHLLDWITVPSEPGGRKTMIWTGDYELRKLTVSWTRTPTVGVVQDPDMCTFHFLQLTGGNPDPVWAAADYVSVENAFDLFWAAIRSSYPPELTLSSYTWRADGPAFKPKGALLSPTLRITPRSLAGTGVAGAACPPQCAISVTEVTEAHYTAYGVGVPGDEPGTGRTQVRNRWGRFYLPPWAPVNLSDGRWSTAVCTLTSSSVKTMYNSCVAAGNIPVMYSPTTGNAWNIIAVHVDDIVDVVRSRRYVQPITRAANDINLPA